jgi:hypothetical protein
MLIAEDYRALILQCRFFGNPGRCYASESVFTRLRMTEVNNLAPKRVLSLIGLDFVDSRGNAHVAPPLKHRNGTAQAVP